MAGIIFWDQKTLNAVDSEIMRTVYKDTISYYHYLYKLLFEADDSPYKTFSETKQSTVSLDEFLWAFCTVGSRSLVLNNTPY
jgi:hypothetical protein